MAYTLEQLGADIRSALKADPRACRETDSLRARVQGVTG
jgi:hypothetical protein